MKLYLWLILTAVVFFAIGFQVKAAQTKKSTSTPTK